MDRLIWTAVTGMNASMMQQRMIASNLANAQTTGFRAEVMAQTPVTLEGPSLEVRTMNDPAVRGARMEPGPVSQTGRALDIALNGMALLAVQAEDGSEAYTRRGDLALSPNGVLVTADGAQVLGEAGPVSIPPGSTILIGPDGAVLTRNPADPAAPPQQIARLKLVSASGSKIEKTLDGLFRVIGGGVLPADAEATLTPAALEQSNVRTSEVLVEMVSAQRLYDMRTKLVATAKELDEQGASLMRMT